MGTLSFDFAGKSVVVTGGAQGIGQHIAQMFLDAGASVSIWDYSAAQASAFKAAEGRLQLLQVDVTDRASVAKAAAALKSPPDILINNAGITRDKSFSKMQPDDWDAVIATNLTGLFNVTKSLLEIFNPASKQKRIVNISSVVALYGNFGQTNYAAAKAGVIGLTKTWAKELGRKGFTVNAVAPGFIKTSMTEKLPAEVLAQMSEKVPVQRLGETADIANTVLFLASDAASYVNGAVISVDGGIVI